MISYISAFLGFAWDFVSYVFRQGSWWINEHEKVVLNAAMQSLRDDDRDAIKRQISSSFFVERIPDGRINIFRFYFPGDLSVAKGLGEDELFRVRIDVQGAVEVANVCFYRGRLFSIEFKHPGRFYKDKLLSVINIEKGSLSDSYTNEIDREEHG